MRYETYSSHGILIILITKLCKNKTPKGEKFEDHPININNLINRICKLQENIGEKIYNFIGNENKTCVDFINDISLLLVSQDIYLIDHSTKIIITPKGYLNGDSLLLPRKFNESISIFLN